VLTLLAAKQKKGESIKLFVERFWSMALCYPRGVTQSTLIKTCHHNLQTSLLAQMGWRNVALWSSWCYMVNKPKWSSLGSGMKKKTASGDPISQCDVHQSRLLNREEGILWQQKSCHLQRPSQSEEIWVPVIHVEIKCTSSRMSTWSLYSSYSKRVTDSIRDQTPWRGREDWKSQLLFISHDAGTPYLELLHL